MKIDIWADIVCPFCYLGKRHLELALAESDRSDDVEIVWHSFQLDPTLPATAPAPLAQMIADKFSIPLEQSQQDQRDVAAKAASVGLEFNWRTARYANTFDAHRLVHLAARHGLATQAETRLMRAYFVEGVEIGHRAELERLGEEIGLPRDEVRSMLAGDDLADEVRADERDAREIGIGGVPFFVFDGKYAVSGAQPVEAFTQVLDRVWSESGPQPAA